MARVAAKASLGPVGVELVTAGEDFTAEDSDLAAAASSDKHPDSHEPRITNARSVHLVGFAEPPQTAKCI